MKKGILIIPLAGAVATVVALGVTAIKPWSWEATAKNHEINYCLLIGQTDHNDSQARTGGIRSALGTRPEITTNPNTETPKQGKLKFTFENGKEEIYTVNELEHKVCVADSGATWDQTTALNMCNTWYSKFQNKITMIVSNNDGMAEGALYSANRPEGMPIFGYDSNSSTLELIKANKITGTVNSNAPAQAAAINILACRILDGTYVYSGPESEDADIYTNLFRGLQIKDKETALNPAGDGKYVEDGKYLSSILGGSDYVKFNYDRSTHSLVCSSNPVNIENVDKFMMDHADQAKAIHASAHGQTRDDYHFFLNTYSKTDTYLQSTYIPLVKDFKPMFGVADDAITDGNGNDEDLILNAIKDKPAQQAYLINMTKTTSADKYITEIYNKINNEEKYKKTPIIFYNRQATDAENKPDPTYMLPGEKNHYNPYVFYVGFDAVEGANIQGKLIQDWLVKETGAGLVEVI